MRLDEYLKALEECPDEFVEIDEDCGKRKVHRLTYELGVYDNWPIFLNADFRKVVEHLQNSNYQMGKQFRNGIKTNHQFFYVPGTVELQVMDYVPFGLGTPDLTEEGKRHFQRQIKDFNIGVVLHPYQKRKMEDVSWQRAIALVIKDFGVYAQGEGIALCFPDSTGWSNLDDYSKIVYHP